MKGDAFPYWLHALSPMHVGAGRGEGYLDLPLVREKVTGYPYVPGSSVKGVFADTYRTAGANDTVLRAAFGQSEKESEAYEPRAGSLGLTDAMLVCLPVPSLLGTLAWCSCRFVLRRLNRDLRMADLPPLPVPVEPGPPASQAGRDARLVALMPDVATGVLLHDSTLFIEDWSVDARAAPDATECARRLAPWAFGDDPWAGEFIKRLVILPDDLFKALARTGTEGPGPHPHRPGAEAGGRRRPLV